jgi:hypothetical protein
MWGTATTNVSDTLTTSTTSQNMSPETLNERERLLNERDHFIANVFERMNPADRKKLLGRMTMIDNGLKRTKADDKRKKAIEKRKKAIEKRKKAIEKRKKAIEKKSKSKSKRTSQDSSKSKRKSNGKSNSSSLPTSVLPTSDYVEPTNPKDVPMEDVQSESGEEECNSSSFPTSAYPLRDVPIYLPTPPMGSECSEYSDEESDEEDEE